MVAKLKPPPTYARQPLPGRSDALRSSLEHRILLGLVAEWDNARWLLPQPLRQSIRKPLFSIRRMQGRLGCWIGDKREIRLSRDLVMSHRWDDIKEVLLHEMAHQVAHEGLQAGSEPDHGSRFRQACVHLRANPAASGTYATLHARLHQAEALTDSDRIVVRIHKLMALAESSNLNEARAAMRKAHELIARHNIELIDRGLDQEYLSVFLGAPHLRHFREAYHLADLLQAFYFVQGIWISAWVMEKEKMGRVLEISGTAKNVRIAEYVHDAVRRYIDRTWGDYRREKGPHRARKTDFAVGVIDGFKTTLQRACAGRHPCNGKHLPVRTDDPALTRYLARRYPQLRSFSRAGTAPDARVLADGAERGRRLIIARGITRREEGTGQLIEYQRRS